MTAVNHAVTGSIIVVGISNPAIGLPLAIMSHFFLDALPHFGPYTVAKPASSELRAIVRLDTFLTVAFILIATFAGYKAGYAVWIIPLGGILGVLPDIMWYKHYKNDLYGQEKDWDILRKTHKRIQRYEWSWGWIIESVWFVLSVAFFSWLIF